MAHAELLQIASKNCSKLFFNIGYQYLGITTQINVKMFAALVV